MRSQLPSLDLSVGREWVELYLSGDWVELSLRIRTSRLALTLLILLNVIRATLTILAASPQLIELLREFIEWLLRALGQ